MKKLANLKLLFLILIITSVSLSQIFIEDFLNHDHLNGAFIGVLFKDIKTDSIIYSYNDKLRFSTASNLKLFTSAAGIELLGPEFRFETSFYANGKIKKNGKLDGDLLIVGGGDPLISGRFRKSITEVLEFWADSLSARGVKNINGDIVVDNSLFESDDLGPGWSLDYLTYWYACPISPLSFNDNCVDFRVFPGDAVDEPCSLVFSPENDYITVINNTATLPAGSANTFDYYRHPETNTVEFFGGIDINDINGVVDYVSVDKPHIYCATIFRDILAKRNIKVKGKVKDTSQDDVASKFKYNVLNYIFSWHSEPMSTIAKVINKNSQNFFAEQTLKMIGASFAGEGSFAVSTKIVSDWLDIIGVGQGDVHYYDGSGLSHMNLASPASIVYLLEYMYDTENFDTYYESMGIPGKDRSVRGRMYNHPLADSMRTKTGTIANTRTFSGYLTTSKGKLVAFSVLVNNYNVSRDEIDDWTDRLCGYIIDNY